LSRICHTGHVSNFLTELSVAHRHCVVNHVFPSGLGTLNLFKIC
jgi:hypothetical protein